MKQEKRWNDPIVAEVRRIRDTLARKFNYDVHSIFEDLRKREGETATIHKITPRSYPRPSVKATAVREPPPRVQK